MSSTLSADRLALSVREYSFQLPSLDEDQRRAASLLRSPAVEGKRISKGFWRPRTKPKVFQEYHGHLGQLDTMRQGANAMLEAAARAGGFGTYPPLPARQQEPMNFFHLAEQPPEAVRTTLDEALAKAGRDLVDDLLASLDAMVFQQQLGLIQWSEHDPQVCRFYFVRHLVKDSSVVSNGMRHHARTHSVAAHLHTLVKALAYYLDDRLVEELRPPEFVRRVTEAVPAWLRPQVRVVAGDQIHEWVVVRELETERWSEPLPAAATYHADPAVVLGPYVLAGWRDGEA